MMTAPTLSATASTTPGAAPAGRQAATGLRLGPETVAAIRAAPLPEEARTILGRLEQVREAGAKPPRVADAMKEARQKMRQNLADELRRLTEQVANLRKLLDPKSAAREAARLAKQIASVARSLAEMSRPEPGEGPGQIPAAPVAPVPTVSATAVAASADTPTGEQGGGEGAAAGQTPTPTQPGSVSTPAEGPVPPADQKAAHTAYLRGVLLQNLDLRPIDDRGRVREQLEGAGLLAPPLGDGRSDPRTKPVRVVVQEAAETIRGLKAMIERGRDQARAEGGRQEGRGEIRRLDREAREVELAARELDRLAGRVDPGLRVGFIDAGGVTA
ncbi:MAG: hypothetical protein RLY86_4402 [Pseudomonadota bacterium]